MHFFLTARLPWEKSIVHIDCLVKDVTLFQDEVEMVMAMRRDQHISIGDPIWCSCARPNNGSASSARQRGVSIPSRHIATVRAIVHFLLSGLYCLLQGCFDCLRYDTMDPDAPIDNDPQPSIFRWILGFLMVGACWGLTTPFMRRAALYVEIFQ